MPRPRSANHLIDPLIAELNRVRKAQGLTAFDMACALDVSATTVTAWERGYRMPGLDSVRLWAYQLGYDLRLDGGPRVDAAHNDTEEAQLDEIYARLRAHESCPRCGGQLAQWECEFVAKQPTPTQQAHEDLQAELANDAARDAWEDARRD